MTVTHITQVFFEQTEREQMRDFINTHPNFYKVSEATIGTVFESKEIFAAELWHGMNNTMLVKEGTFDKILNDDSWDYDDI